MADRQPWSKMSLTAQALGHVDPLTKAIVPPIHISTTYIRDPDNGYSSGFVYGRPDNATVRDTEAVIAMLEEAEAGAVLFSSGMSAATACFLALDPGDHIVASSVMYWGLRNWLVTEGVRLGLRIDLVETAPKALSPYEFDQGVVTSTSAAMAAPTMPAVLSSLNAPRSFVVPRCPPRHRSSKSPCR